MKKQHFLLGLLGLTSLIAAIFLIRSPSRPQGSEHEKVRIDALLPLTGSSAFLGEFCMNGMQLAAEKINAAGGIRGVPLELVFTDTKNDPKEGVTAFQKALITKPAAVIVAMSSIASSIAPLADAEKIPLFATMVSSKNVTENHPSMVRLFINADIDARLMAEFATQSAHLKALAIISVNDEMGNSFSNVFSERVAALGGRIVIHERFDKSANDFRDIASKVKQHPVDAIYLLGYDGNLGQLAKTLREQGVSQPLLSIATIAQEPVRAVAGDALNGVFFTSVAFDANAPQDPVTKSFILAYQTKFGKLPTYFSAFSYDSVLLLADAIERGGTDHAAIIKSLTEIQTFAGATGTISFAGTRDARFPMTVKKFVDGKIQNAH